MTPGDYLYLQRRAANFSRLDVALRTETDPPVSCMAREQLLVSIEAGLTPMVLDDAVALAKVEELRIDLPRLCDLIEVASVADRPRFVAIGDEGPR